MSSSAEGNVSEDHFVSELRKEYAALEPGDRKKKIRELVAESKDNKQFILASFPDFFSEAFPVSKNGSNRVGRKSVSSVRSAQAAKRR
jgi:hypothetical protein